jgi:hypothetical protein
LLNPEIAKVDTQSSDTSILLSAGWGNRSKEALWTIAYLPTAQMIADASFHWRSFKLNGWEGVAWNGPIISCGGSIA